MADIRIVLNTNNTDEEKNIIINNAIEEAGYTINEKIINQCKACFLICKDDANNYPIIRETIVENYKIIVTMNEV